MEILVCVKRVPASGGAPQLTDDGQGVDTRNLAFTVGPHEECAIEEAISLVSRLGGSVTVLTVGPAEAEEQLRYAISMGADHGILVDAGTTELDPQATADAIATAVRGIERGRSPFDLILFGNESPDAGHYQVGIRVAHALSRPIVGGVKGIDVSADPVGSSGSASGSGSRSSVRARRDTDDGVEVYELALPAAVAVKEGLNLPRYPSMRGRLRARKAELAGAAVAPSVGGMRMTRLRLPEQNRAETVLLGHGAAAAPAVVDLFEELDVI